MSASVLSLVMPADSRFISTARVTAASLAAEIDFSVDEIEELRMGANELVAILTELAADNDVATVELRYVVDNDSIEVHGEVAVPADQAAELDILAKQILDAVVDSYAFDGPSGHLVKRRTIG